MPVVTTTTTIAQAKLVRSWSAGGTDIKAAMAVDHADPKSGDPVRFTLDLSSSEPCCVVTLAFGDGSPDFFVDLTQCGVAPGTAHADTTHTYAGAGTYIPSLRVLAADWCHPTPGPPGSPPIPPVPRQVLLSACIAAGGGSSGKGCPTQSG